MVAACLRGFSEGREIESKAAATAAGLPLCLNLAQKLPSGLSVNRQIDAVPPPYIQDAVLPRSQQFLACRWALFTSPGLGPATGTFHFS